MKGENSQKTLFSGRAVSHDPPVFQCRSHLGPQIDKARGVQKLLVRNAMHLLSGPCDWPCGAEVGIQGHNRKVRAPMHNSDLHGLVGEAWSGSRTLKVNRCKGNLLDFHVKGEADPPAIVQVSRSNVAVVSQSMQASVMDTPYCSFERSEPSGCAP